ncbi:MAG TPA: hypothetical protein PK689_02670 [Kiritimatiellia bacterium]|jgi:hypothetical protein|nr:hypothetical protein [Kiritimatiellia bacterium]
MPVLGGGGFGIGEAAVEEFLFEEGGERKELPVIESDFPARV